MHVGHSSHSMQKVHKLQFPPPPPQFTRLKSMYEEYQCLFAVYQPTVMFWTRITFRWFFKANINSLSLMIHHAVVCYFVEEQVFVSSWQNKFDGKEMFLWAILFLSAIIAINVSENENAYSVYDKYRVGPAVFQWLMTTAATHNSW